MSGDFAQKIFAAYPDDLSVNVVASLGDERPSASYGAQFRRSASYFGDVSIIANRRKTCETWAAAKLPVYSFRFDTIPDGVSPEMAITHFQEVAFVFNNALGVGYDTPPYLKKSKDYYDLAEFMSSSWISFMNHLNPNKWRETYAWNGSEPEWPLYNSSSPTSFVFDGNKTSYLEADVFRKEAIQLINDNVLSVYLR
jgi:carboxylesterase type B